MLGKSTWIAVHEKCPRSANIASDPVMVANASSQLLIQVTKVLYKIHATILCSKTSIDIDAAF